MIFPLAYLSLTSAVTVLLILLGLADRPALAAEVAVIQGALLATFYAFSANTRSLILQGHGALRAEHLLAKRLLFLPLLCIAAFALCVGAADVSATLAALLILRRACEWTAEVRLCEIEVAGDAKAARRVLGVQAVTTAAAAIALVVAPQGLSVAALGAFALAPLVGVSPRIRLRAFAAAELRATLRDLSPHIGSTAVIGLSIYLVRLVVFLLVDADTAGLLFTAFALGSFVATIFANVLGPTLALQRTRDTHHGLVRLVRYAVVGMAVGGVAFGAAGAFGSAWLGKPHLFWLALGCTMIGGSMMVVAHVQRLLIFQAQVGEILFGPDVLRVLILVMAVPALHYLVHPDALAALYLVDGLLMLFLYWSARRQALHEHPLLPRGLEAFIAALLFLPLFFLLRGGIYHSAEPLLDSGGSVLDVPLPLALPACFAAIALIGRYRDATVSLGTIFFLFVGMVMTTVVATDGSIDYESRKLLLLFQLLVPAFAVVLGQMIGTDPGASRPVGLAFLAILAIIVPLQIARSYGYGWNELRHDLWIASIYQHRQFVPVIFSAAYVFGLFAGWQAPAARPILVLLAPFMGYYATASYSTLAASLLLVGVLLAAVRMRGGALFLCAALAIGSMVAYVYVNRDAPPMKEKYTPGASEIPRPFAAPKGEPEPPSSLPRNIGGRWLDWKLYGRGIVESHRTALFGHPRALGRDVSTSAHNYYLDFLYNFGLLAFLPFAWLILYTLARLWRWRAEVWKEPAFLGLALVVVFGIAVDNNFKVTFRQPYPGIFFFFLWGLLLSRLSGAGGSRPTSRT